MTVKCCFSHSAQTPSPYAVQGRRKVKKCGVDIHGECKSIIGIWGLSPQRAIEPAEPGVVRGAKLPRS